MAVRDQGRSILVAITLVLLAALGGWLIKQRMGAAEAADEAAVEESAPPAEA